ncbi:MAG: preprotein translocase subunit SecE, partial [Solirubrobacterales bacterium]
RKARAKELQKGQAEKAEKRRGPILGFLLSCWAELKRVQWPDRDTLVQASAVTFIFVAVMAAYLGALDAAFNWFIKQLL